MIQGEKQITQSELEVIRFIEGEFKINEIIEKNIEVMSISELNLITEPIFVDMVKTIGQTLNISMEEAVLLYNKYTDVMSMVAQLIMLTEGTTNG